MMDFSSHSRELRHSAMAGGVDWRVMKAARMQCDVIDGSRIWKTFEGRGGERGANDEKSAAAAADDDDADEKTREGKRRRKN